MPTWLRDFADAQPVTKVVYALRAIAEGIGSNLMQVGQRIRLILDPLRDVVRDSSAMVAPRANTAVVRNCGPLSLLGIHTADADEEAEALTP